MTHGSKSADYCCIYYCISDYYCISGYYCISDYYCILLLHDRQMFRFRCRKCADTEFCASCMHTPYHLGFTCDQFARYC